jgi:ABC-type uncharacterized transport system substrate-binding protein
MGALLAVSADYTDMGCQTGQLALNILEHPEKKYGILYPQNFKIYINKRVADLFGLKISAKLMKQATKIYN